MAFTGCDKYQDRPRYQVEMAASTKLSRYDLKQGILYDSSVEAFEASLKLVTVEATTLKRHCMLRSGNAQILIAMSRTCQAVANLTSLSVLEGA